MGAKIVGLLCLILVIVPTSYGGINVNEPLVNSSPPFKVSSTVFYIRILDSETENPVPLVQVRTSHYITMYSDSAGGVTFYEPGMMDMPVWFSVLTDGYELDGGVPCTPTEKNPCDPGLTLVTTPGTSATIKMRRTQVAQRMYRLTGQGLYRDTVMAGGPAPIPNPLLDKSGLSGQDTLVITTYKGRHYWFFGDTVCVRSSRQANCDNNGMFTVGASSCIPGSNGNCESGEHPALDYFRQKTDDGWSVKPMAPVVDLKMNTWVGGTFTVLAGTDREAMYGIYLKPYSFGPPPHDKPADNIGLIRWSDDIQQFKFVEMWPNDHPLARSGSAVVQLRRPGEEDGYVYFNTGIVYARCPENNVTLDAFEAYTPLKPGSTMDNPVLNEKGWQWQRNMQPIGRAEEDRLLQSGVLPKAMAIMQTVDAKTGVAANPGGSLNYNRYLDMYVTIDNTYIGFSKNMMGPWTKLHPVLNHDATKSSCYNPVMVTHLNDNTSKDPKNTRYVYVACSYTAMWSNDPPAKGTNLWQTCLFGQNAHMNCSPVVPRYEYNNLIYRVDLKEMKTLLEN